MKTYEISPFDEPSKVTRVRAVDLFAAMDTFAHLTKEGKPNLETPNTFTTEWGRYCIRRVKE